MLSVVHQSLLATCKVLRLRFGWLVVGWNRFCIIVFRSKCAKFSVSQKEVIFLGSVSTGLVQICPRCVGGRPPHSQGRASDRFSGITAKAYLVGYDLNIMSSVLLLRLSGFLSQWWFFSDSHLLRRYSQ